MHDSAAGDCARQWLKHCEKPRLSRVKVIVRVRAMMTTGQTRSLKQFKVDELPVRIFRNGEDLAAEAAEVTHAYLTSVIAKQGQARVILATGRSQVDFLKRLVAMPGLDWKKVTCFHMDEYLGISADHPGSFRRYLRERVESLVQPKEFHWIQGDTWLPLDECDRYEKLLQEAPIDLCCLGIGENGHLAFNDPPVARFNDKRLVKLLKLDDVCKNQQFKEGHFPSIEAVPPYAFSLTVPALCIAKAMLCVAPEKRKAEPVRWTLEGPIAESCPASFLRKQPHCLLFLDEGSASNLSSATVGK
ncbi:MAG TPA: glucosamine-6-phosphate deaminase [Methylomirabilota bacterium]|nr:glucosamine-6-phosphate deaminase [Methylomirabilota bacterium]